VRLVVPVSDETAWPRALVGAKAFNLQRLMIAGQNVPPCSVVTTEAFTAYHGNGVEGQLLDGLSAYMEGREGTVIARSSSPHEDTGGSSQAGVFETVPDVKTLEQLKGAVERVWRSGAGMPIGVVLQQQVSPDVAGVLFTRNPVTGKDEDVIEYVKGMGEALVSSRVNPRRAGAGDARFSGLRAAGAEMEKAFGYPLDVEWAMKDGELFILQARPIVSLPIPPPGTAATYSRVMAEQFYSGPVSPLFFSVFRDSYGAYGERAMKALGVGTPPLDEMLVRHKDHIYAHTSPSVYALEKLGDAVAERQGDVLPEDMRVGGKRSRAARFAAVAPLVLRMMWHLLRRPGLRPARLDGEYKRNTVPAILNGLRALERAEGDLCRLRRDHLRLKALLEGHISASILGMGYCILFTNMVTRDLARSGVEDGVGTLMTLLSGLEDNRTKQGVDELRALAAKYNEDREVVDALGTYAEAREALADSPAGRMFLEAFASIISRYGHRRVSRDIMEPSWRDEPEIPFSVLAGLMRERGGAGRAPDGTEQEKFLSGLPRRKRKRARYLRRYVTFREYQRFYLDMILSAMRDNVLAIGRVMKQRGVIDVPEDVFFLDVRELEEFMEKGVGDLRRAARFRRLSFKEDDATPGSYLRGGVDFNSVEKESEQVSADGGIKGEAVSPGTFRGVVRVIPHIDAGSKIAKGDVLVTRSIDPGQTQCFAIAGAMILEVGGVLSHGAILAREYGIPTVAQVKNATGIFRDGQEVVVDGGKGVVRFVKE